MHPPTAVCTIWKEINTNYLYNLISNTTTGTLNYDVTNSNGDSHATSPLDNTTDGSKILVLWGGTNAGI